MDYFIKLPTSERALLFNEAAKRHGGMSAKILEKDFWVCWTLKRLFTLSEISQHLTFKGGTSLSKVYGLIDRFSEDVDLTIDKEYLEINSDDWLHNSNSRKTRQEFRKVLDKACAKALTERLLPLLKKQFLITLTSLDWDLRVSDTDALTILFHYPPSINYSMGAGGEEEPAYIKPVIRLEFGARGDSFPTELRTIISYVSDILPEIFDKPNEVKIEVNVLDAKRTFWEKIIILHELYYNDKGKILKQHIARHYYDTVMLFKKGVAFEALENQSLLKAVVSNARINCTDSSESQNYKSYETLLQSNIKLVPQVHNIAGLKKDYNNMQQNGMFFGNYLNFDEVLKELALLEDMLNADKI